MTKEEIKEYLKENLSIDIVTEHEFFQSTRLKAKVTLKLEEEVISESYDTFSVCSS